MSSLTNVNNNAAVVVVGRTAPVPPGQQPAAKSIPVVLASDQTPIPVVEQNKIASEVALSLLGIPRAEVALGIFADVNTYDVNPSEWSSKPEIRQDLASTSEPAYAGFNGTQGWGIKHIPEESGALVEAPADKVSVLTSKRFFRYQPGRVSATTFGVKTSVISGDPNGSVRNPAIRKYGAFDNYDGYYWETRDTGKGDQLVVVRRTSSLMLENPLAFGTSNNQQLEDYAIVGTTSTNPGNLVVLRDGLVHVHAAVYDPSLLRTETLHSISAITSNALTLTIASDQPELFDGQHVSYETDATAISGLVKQKIYKIINKTTPINSVYTVKLALIDDTVAITLGTLTGTHKLKTPVPFIFPTIITENAGDIMWPFKRTFDINRNALGSPVGIVDTVGSISDTAANILSINNGSIELHWANWVKWNVNPEYYRVYEYRVPRSRFSGDFLNGTQGTDAQNVLYSDVVRTGSGNDTIKRPGQPVISTATNSSVTKESIWNLDFTKVTMQKVEYSWYGAVGALFLAYIPVSNGEARWVRVHHIRCSNQLKVPSLGNATLPITYLVYGGGSENRNGYTNASSGGKRLPNQYGTYSEYIVKYGASYYIDGGDRGTVRLYSYSSPNASDVYGSKYRMKTTTIDSSTEPYLAINETAPYNVNPVISDFYMGATVLTTDPADQGVKVIWVDATTTPKRLYLNKALNSLTDVVKLDVLVDRPQITYGLRTKTQITSSQGSTVRNRVQVYPTRLAIGAAGTSTVSVQLVKNPIFQTYSAYSGTLTLDTGTTHILKPEGQPTLLTLTGTGTTPTFTDGSTAYGWIQGYFTADSQQRKFTVFGLLRRIGSVYTFTAEDTLSGEIRIIGKFLHAKNYDNDGSLAYPITSSVVSGRDYTVTELGSTTAAQWKARFDSLAVNTFPTIGQVIIATSTGSIAGGGTVVSGPIEFELERLSSIKIANELRTPIPGTGTQVTTFFIGSGGFQFDLSPYFNYNKDYLSYPLTNKIDSLYLTSTSVDKYINIDGSGDPTGSPVLRSSVLTSLTWEEQ